MNDSKLHFWIRQLRRPLCALIVVAIVLAYGFISHAEGETQTFLSRFGLSSAGDIPVLSTVSMYNSFTNSGNDGTTLYCTTQYRNFQYFPSLFQTVTSWESSRVSSLNSLTWPGTITENGVTYDFSNSYLFSVYQNGMKNQYAIGNKIVIADGYMVSADPFYIYSPQISVDSQNHHVKAITTAAANGLYMTPALQNTSTQATIWFSDLDIFFRSSDGSSGYSSFSENTIGDFDISSVNSYFNFNVLKTGDYIVSPSDPAENPYNSEGEHYNYGSVSHKVYGNPFDTLYYGTTIGINSYMRDYSNKFWLFTDAKIGVKFAGDNDVSEFEQNDSVSISSFIRNGSYNYSQRLDPGLMMNGGQSLASKLHTNFQTITGSDYNYTDGSWGLGSFDDQVINGLPYLDYRQYTFKGINRSLVGSTDSKLEVAYLDLTTWFSYDGTNDDILNIDDTSGMYHVRYNLLNGTYDVMQNDIVQNLNPIEGEANLPISGGESGGNTTNNNPINISQGGISNYISANIEYLFNLDASGLANVTANVGNTVQYVVTQITDTSQNGFWAVLKRAYAVIPDPIWTWIYTSVGVLLSGAIFSWVYNGVRIKRGA